MIKKKFCLVGVEFDFEDLILDYYDLYVGFFTSKKNKSYSYKRKKLGKENFKESISDPETIVNTLRLNDRNGEIVGFSKGGPLEKYQLREEVRDENYGLKNTVFLEPLALKMGYWGLRGGSEMRHLFIMQAHSMKYKHLTSFALRDVIKARVDKENAEFVTQFDPERWDYYRIKI